MRVQYGVVDLGTIVHTREMVREVVNSQDLTTFHFVRWVVDIDAVWNPRANSYSLDSNNANARPVAFGGLSPTITDKSLRNYLAQPQRQLILTVGGQELLRTPGNDDDTDAYNGPRVESCVVREIHGEKLFAISIRIVAHTNEAPFAGGLRPVLLSHRWQRFVDVDEDHFAQIITQGYCQFRTDELLFRETFPDNYRHELFHPVPANFRRVSVRVTPLEDGAAMHYRIIDTEQSHNVATSLRPKAPNAPNDARFSVVDGRNAVTEIRQGGTRGLECTRLEVYDQCSLTDPTLSIGVVNVLASGSGSILGSFSHVTRTRSRSRAALPAVGAGLLDAAIRATRTVTHKVTVRAWGNRLSRRGNLQSLVIAITLARLYKFFPEGCSSEALIGHDVVGKMVEMEMANVYPLGFRVHATTGQTLPNNTPGLDYITNFHLSGVLGDDTNLRPIFDNLIGQDRELLTQNRRANTPLPFSRGTRGSWVGEMVAQGLSDENELPPFPNPLVAAPQMQAGFPANDSPVDPAAFDTPSNVDEDL